MSRRFRDFYFTIDPRSLALFRILIGLLLIKDCQARWSHIESFYTSFGVVETNLIPRLNEKQAYFLWFDHVDSLRGVQLIFLLGLVVYVLFVLGYRTRIVTALSLLFFASVVGRNVLIRHGGDTVMATMLMWSVFLPLGKRFSLDAIAGKNLHREVKSPFSFAASAIVCQIVLIYLASALTKYGSTWKNGTALYYVLNIDQFVYPLGAWFAARPMWLLKALTWGVLVLEFAVVPLVLLPFGQPYLRRIAVVALTGMQLGIWTLMNIGDFPLVMISLNALLLTSEDWQLLRRRFPGSEAPDIQSHDAGAASAAAPPVNVWAQAGRLITNWLVVVIFMWVLISAYNINLAERFEVKRINELALLDSVLSTLQLDQDWHLFAPDPISDDGWWVIDGTTKSGQHVDPLTGKPPAWDKPNDLADRYDRFWRKYLYRLWKTRNQENLAIFADYIARKDRRDHAPGQQLATFDFYYVLEMTPPPGRPKPFQTQRVLLWSFSEL